MSLYGPRTPAVPFSAQFEFGFVNLIRDGGPVGACAQDPNPENNELVTNLSSGLGLKLGPKAALRNMYYSIPSFMSYISFRNFVYKNICVTILVLV